jgi:hypothetical protein
MKVRFKFSADLYIEGNDMNEVKNKFESLQLFSNEADIEGHADFCELLLVEDADSYDDLMSEYLNCHESDGRNHCSVTKDVICE